MAAIALIVASTGSTAATKTKAALEAEGHTVTFVVEGNIGTTDFSGFDCAAAVACTANSTVANALRSLVDDDNLPMFVGSVSAGLGAAYIPQLMHLNGPMTSDYVYGQGPYAINITNATHDITSPFGLGYLDISTGTQYWACVASGESFAGVQLAVGYDVGGGINLTGLVDTFAISRGTMDLAGTPAAIGARVVVSGALYGGTHPVLNYTADAKTFFDNVIEWLIAAGDEPTQPTIDEVVELPASLALSTSAFEAAVAYPADEHESTTVEVAAPADTTFASPLFTFTFEYPSSLTNLLLEGLDSLETYILRVKYTGLLGIDSLWSATATATTLDDVIRPTAPTVTVGDHAHDFVEAVTSAFAHAEGTTTAALYDPESPLPYLQAVQWQIRITATSEVVYDSGFITPATLPPEIDYHGLDDPSTGHQIRARHFDGYHGAASLWGTWAAFTTHAVPPDAPLAPDVTVTSCDGSGEVTVEATVFAHSDPPATHVATQWKAVMGGGYLVHYTTDPTELLTYLFDGIPPGEWTFSARYLDDSGRWGDYGTTDTCTVANPPSQPTLNHSGSTRVCANITISWNAPSNQSVPSGGWIYEGQISSNDGVTWTSLFTARTVSYHLFDIAAYPDATYLFRVRANFPTVDVPGDWSYLVLRVDRSCAETTVYDFSTLTALDADWEVFWDNDAANVWWRPVDQWGREQFWWTPLSGGAYGIMASGLKIGHQTRSALAFKELGQPTLYEAETEFVIWGSECYWPGWRWAHTVLMRGGLAYAINGHDDDPTPNTRGGVCQTASSGNTIFAGPYFGGTCCWHCPNLCLNGCVAANGCQCVQAIVGWWQVKRDYPDQLIEYGTPAGSGFIQHWGFRPGHFVQSSYENATIPHAGIKQRGLSVTRNACGSYYPTPDGCTPYHTKYVFRQKVERTVTGGIRMRAMVVGPGVDPAAGWTIDKTLSYAEAQAMGCGWVGLAFDELHSYIPDTGIIFRSFSITPVEYDDCLAPVIPEEPPPSPISPIYSPCPPDMDTADKTLFLGGTASPGAVFRFGGYEVAAPQQIVARIRPNSVAPEGYGGECLFKSIFVVVEHISDINIRIVPILNGEWLDEYAQEETFIGPGDRAAIKRYEMPLYRAFEDLVVEGGDDPVDRFKYGLRGTYFTFDMTITDLCGIGLQLPGVWLEYEAVRESQGTRVIYTEDLVRLPLFVPTGQTFMGTKGANRVLKAASGVTDDGLQVEARMVSNPVAPAGEAGECHFKRVTVVVTRWNANDMDLKLTPYLDGYPAPPITVHYKATTAPVTEPVEIDLTQYYRRLGADATERFRYGLRGAWFHAKVETGSGLQEWLTLEGFDLDYDVVRESLQTDVR